MEKEKVIPVQLPNVTHFPKVAVTQDVYFEVQPELINQNLFKETRADENQEKTRLLILEAFEEMKKNPDKYGNNFMTIIPEKYWNSMNVKELKKEAHELGDHIADWVEQALEWAQRINNGETWEKICNEPDTAKWQRLVIWKDGYTRIVGGSFNNFGNDSVACVYSFRCYSTDYLSNVVPLVILY